MSVIKPKLKKDKSSLDELKSIVNETKFSESIVSAKTIVYNNLVKNLVKNIDYIIVAGVTFYLTKSLYSVNCGN